MKRSLITILTFLLTLFVTSSCGRKLNPTLDDYIEPVMVSKFNISVIDKRVTLSWSYPEKEKGRIKGFIIERENKGEKQTLGFYDKNSNLAEDKDIRYGYTYIYSIFAVKPKGVLSKPTKIELFIIRLPEIENLKAKVTPLGVNMSWQSEASLNHNIYRVNDKGEKIKLITTENKTFTDEMTCSFLNTLKESSKGEVHYLITTLKANESVYIESEGLEIGVSLKKFIPSKPSDIFEAINEQGVSITWKEVPESWNCGYKIYRKTQQDKDFVHIGDTSIPLYLDREYNLKNLKFPIYYRITSKGILEESDPVEIKIEVHDG